MTFGRCVLSGAVFAMLAYGMTGCATDEAFPEKENQAHATPAGDGAVPPVSMAGRTESDLVNELVVHREAYAQYLRAMATFYSENGYEQKARWAREELTQVQKVRQANYLSDNQAAMGAARSASGSQLKIPVTGVTEADLLEEMVLHRKNYEGFLQTLVAFYTENGLDQKANLARTELKDYRKVKQYVYDINAELPLASLRPTESIPEADKLYEEAKSLLLRGGHHVIIFFNRATMNTALNKFKELIAKYPTSDKIDDAAYYIAEIYKEYGEERDNQLAIQWYERAVTWNPKLPHPAWSHAAHVLDFRMHEREKALAWYQKVLVCEEGMDKTDARFAMNVKVAHKRIEELSGEKTRNAAGDAVPEPRPEPTGSPAPNEGATASPKPAPVQ